MDDAQVAEPSTSRAARLWRVAAVGAVATAVVSTAWWVTHPTRLNPVGSEVGLPGVVGQPVVVGLFAYPQSGSVVLREAAPRVAPGSAAADVRVLWCAGPTGGTPLGALTATAQASCSETPPVAGRLLALPAADNGFGHLVVEIVPREPGQVTVEGADVSYSAGVQRGKQASGLVVKVEVPG